MRTARNGEVKIHIDAPTQKVWEMLANLDRMGDWSPECRQVVWLDGAQSPAKVGARFKGSNKYDWMKWSMKCEVKAAEPGRELSWSTMQGDREMVRWRYVLEPADGGTELTESFECVWLPLYARLAEDVLMRDRDRRRQDAMRTTLERIKGAVEQPTPTG